MMPVVTKEMSQAWARRRWRPVCSKCGRFIGEGGFYDVMWDGYNGGWEEGYSTCRQHTQQIEDGGHGGQAVAR